MKTPPALTGELIPAGTPSGYKRRPTLTTARGIRKELAALYLEFRRGELDDGQARTGAFILQTLLSAVRADDLEQRLEELESKGPQQNTLNVVGFRVVAAE